MTVRIVVGNALAELPKLKEESVHVCATSPPYWGLRDYGLEPTIWGGDPDCDHLFVDEQVAREVRKGMGLEELSKRYRGGGKKHGKIATFTICRGSCQHCGAWRGALGLEPTPELFIEHMVLVFREVRRVLRSDGCCYVNMGDSYASGGGAGDQGRSGDRFERAHTQKYLGVQRGKRTGTNAGKHRRTDGVVVCPADQPNRFPQIGLKAKDLVGIPWMLAFALRADGWYLRQEIIWHKPNPMPESTEDRCTKAHEHIFHLTKSERYFYDAEAIKEDAIYGGEDRPTFRGGAYVHDATFDNSEGGKSTDVGNIRRPQQSKLKGDFLGKRAEAASTGIQQAFRAIRQTRNKRSVWTIATAPFSEAHFATFPPALIEPCILAGTSERGCCPTCRAGWQRVTAPTERYAAFLGSSYHDHGNDEGAGMMQHRGENRPIREVGGIVGKETETIGWYPTCRCADNPPLPKYPKAPKKIGVEPDDGIALEGWRHACRSVDGARKRLCETYAGSATVTAVVLDPFGGAGTTGLVADRHQRDAILIEANPDYAKMSRRRLDDDSPLFKATAAE